MLNACRYSTEFGRLLWEPEWVPDVTTVLRGPESNRRLEVMSLPRYLSSTPLSHEDITAREGFPA
jgi:hypothetical protein